MRVSLMTRGVARGLDYDYLDQAPSVTWWEPVAEFLDLERVQVVVRGLGGRAAVLVSALPSRRRDIIGTPIGYTVVLEDVDEPDLVSGLVAAALTENGQKDLGRALDEMFPPEEIEALLRGKPGSSEPASGKPGSSEPASGESVSGEPWPDESVASRAERALRAAVDAVDARPTGGSPVVGLSTGSAEPCSWVSSPVCPDARPSFAARARDLAAEGQGWAFTTSALTSEQGARSAADRLAADGSAADGSAATSLAILLLDGTVDDLLALGKSPAGKLDLPIERHRPLRIVLAVAAVITLAWVMTEVWRRLTS